MNYATHIIDVSTDSDRIWTVQEIIAAAIGNGNGGDGSDGLGWTGGTYNASTGVVTFASDDGLGFSTDDLRGAAGEPGADGNDGATGPAGADGVDGSRGADGVDGSDGATGPAGADGVDGAPGADGLDGSELANVEDITDGAKITNDAGDALGLVEAALFANAAATRTFVGNAADGVELNGVTYVDKTGFGSYALIFGTSEGSCNAKMGYMGGSTFQFFAGSGRNLKIGANNGSGSTIQLRPSGGINLTSVPTSDPAIAGDIWNDSGTLKISAG